MIVPESLLEPVPGDDPRGIDLRNPSWQPPLSELNQAFKTAARRPDQTSADARADWAEVEQQAAAVLADSSKDIVVAAWLAEALVRTEGYAGLAAGGRVIAGLVGRFWPILFPAPRKDEAEAGVTPEQARLEPLADLVAGNGRLLAALRAITLFTLEDGTPFSLKACEDSKAWTALGAAQRQKRLTDLTPENRALLEQSPVSRMWDTVRTALGAGGQAAVVACLADIAAAADAWQEVAAAVAAQAGPDAFDPLPLLDRLDDARSILTELAVTGADTAAPAEGSAEAPRPPAREAPADSREDALRRLADLCAFFRRTEPYSPVPFMLEEALRRARMSWPDLLAEIVPDKSQRDTVLMRLGLRPDGPAG